MRSTGLIRRFRRDSRGGIAMLAALGVPALAVLAIAASELMTISVDRNRMQDVADAAALDAADQLALAVDLGVLERAKTNVEGQLASLRTRSSVEVAAELVENDTGVRVGIVARRPSFFGSMLPPGGFVTSVSSTALHMRRDMAPLCVLATDPAAQLEVVSQAKMTAGECLVHSNNDIHVLNATLLADTVQASGAATGAPDALVGAETVADPFADLQPNVPRGCDDTDRIYKDQPSAVLPKGRHCGKFEVENSTVTFAPGKHFFYGELQMKKGAKLVGEGVTLIFGEDAFFTMADEDDPNTTFEFTGQGETADDYAGFVLVADKDRTQDLRVPARYFRRLEGVVYVPNAKLVIEPDDRDTVKLQPAGQSSAWTVVIARAIKVQNGTDLLIYADYSGSDVPVPDGVGDKYGRLKTRLQH